MIDDVIIKHGGLPQVLPLAVQVKCLGIKGLWQGLSKIFVKGCKVWSEVISCPLKKFQVHKETKVLSSIFTHYIF